MCTWHLACQRHHTPGSHQASPQNQGEWWSGPRQHFSLTEMCRSHLSWDLWLSRTFPHSLSINSETQAPCQSNHCPIRTFGWRHSYSTRIWLLFFWYLWLWMTAQCAHSEKRNMVYQLELILQISRIQYCRLHLFLVNSHKSSCGYAALV